MKRAPLFSIIAMLVAPAMMFAQSASAGRGMNALRDLSASLEQLAAKVRPAVVQIFSTGYAQPQDKDSDTSNAALLAQQTSTGSGVILTADGYIVTNNHVIDNARKIQVKLSRTDSTGSRSMTLSARVVGVDRETDLAVLKIDATALPTLTLGDSSQLRQGELVMAFGNPFGLEGTATTGVVSSTSRQLKEDDPLAYIQTDAPINPGNSGGPLVDMDGRVVGINTMIYTRSGGSEGIGFALPSNVVQIIYSQIRKDGHAHRGHIGVSVQTISPVLAKGLGLSQDWGVVVNDVEPDSPAEKAGVMIGDIVHTLDGKTIEDASQMENEIYRMTLKENVHLGLLRAGKALAVTVPVHEREDDPMRFADMVTPESNLISKLGILAVEINDEIAAMVPDLRHEYGLVVAARSSSPPYTGPDLETGDVIYEVNRTPTLSVKALRDELDMVKPGGDVVLQVERDGTLLYLPLELQ